MRRHIVTFILTLALSFPAIAGNTAAHHLHIDRAHKLIYVLNADGSVAWQAPCGIGRGGLAQKKSMADTVTPTGAFVVDLILDQQPQWDQSQHPLPLSLAQLFQNMNAIDFNHDGRPDHAYGSAYIGLDSKTAITGPKLTPYRDGTLYWFSIALHGTPDIATIGKAASGGCVHLSAETLARLIEDGLVTIGTRVIITDGSPKL